MSWEIRASAAAVISLLAFGYSVYKIKRGNPPSLLLLAPFVLLALAQPLTLFLGSLRVMRYAAAFVGFIGLSWLCTKDKGVLRFVFLVWGVEFLRLLALRNGWRCDFAAFYLEFLKVKKGLFDTLYAFKWPPMVKVQGVVPPELIKGGLIPDREFLNFTGYPGVLPLLKILPIVPYSIASKIAQYSGVLGFYLANFALYRKYADKPWGVLMLWLPFYPYLEVAIGKLGSLSIHAVAALGIALFIESPVAQGFLCALGAMLKPFFWPPILLMPILKPKGRWLTAWGITLALTIATLIIFGPGVFERWLRLGKISSALQWTFPYSSSVAGVTYHITHNKALSLALHWLVAFSLGSTLFIIGVKRKKWSESAALWILGASLLPLALWRHHLLVTLFAALALLRKYPYITVSVALFVLSADKVLPLCHVCHNKISPLLLLIGAPLVILLEELLQKRRSTEPIKTLS